MATEVKSLDQNIQEANFQKQEEDRLNSGGGRATSPAAAASMGASPAQAKMVGSRAASSLA